MPNDDNDNWLKPAFAEIYRVLANDSFAVSFYGWPMADRFMAAYRAAGFCIVGHLIFPKTYSSSTRFLRYQHESAHLLVKAIPANQRGPYPTSFLGNTPAINFIQPRSLYRHSSHWWKHSPHPTAPSSTRSPEVAPRSWPQRRWAGPILASSWTRHIMLSPVSVLPHHNPLEISTSMGRVRAQTTMG